MKPIQKIGFGGGCHWCTEAVFQMLKGVSVVEQGWIASEGEAQEFSEAVIVTYNAEEISLEILIEIHLYTHKSTSQHSMREKYRSAVYYFNAEDSEPIKETIRSLQSKFNNEIITQTLAFKNFKASHEAIKNYYLKNPQKPFCETYINPKLKLLIQQFTSVTIIEALTHIK
ncbi:peptide-methionine (S)-S-oxide reductase [Mariniflexile sp. AS56]|uniref:peptide-methionine (S)-S-oxide reductase n=1 Tax=Mariniflexile sp. AS56 TaxID=3063957 RepID=UPI0034E93982